MRSMSVAVFGPLALEGASLSPRERAVLSALVLRAGRPVTTDELAEALWGDELPGTWPKQLQASIGRVRTAIGRNAIETSPGAYTLRIDPDTVDAERFERLAASARQHVDDDPARAADAADRALAALARHPVRRSLRLAARARGVRAARRGADGTGGDAARSTTASRRARRIRRGGRGTRAEVTASGATLGAARHRALPERPAGRRARRDPRGP